MGDQVRNILGDRLGRMPSIKPRMPTTPFAFVYTSVLVIGMLISLVVTFVLVALLIIVALAAIIIAIALMIAAALILFAVAIAAVVVCVPLLLLNFLASLTVSGVRRIIGRKRQPRPQVLNAS